MHIVVCWVFHNSEWTERWSEILSPALNSHWLCWGECKVNARWQTCNRTGKLYFTNKMTWVHPETPSHRRACMGLSQAGHNQYFLPDHSQELFFQRRQRWIFAGVLFLQACDTEQSCVCAPILEQGHGTTHTSYVHDWKKSPWVNPCIFSCLYQLRAYPLHPGRSVWNTPNAGASPHPTSSTCSFEAGLGFVLPLATSPWWYLGMPREVTKLKKNNWANGPDLCCHLYEEIPRAAKATAAFAILDLMIHWWE